MFSYVNCTNVVTGKTIAQLVRIPLPTCALDLDEVGGSLPPPFPETGGIVCSRYLTRDNLDSVLASIREKDDFDRLKDDPALDLPSDDVRYFTHEELLDRVRTTLDGRDERDSDDEEDERGRQESTSTYDRRRSSSTRSVGPQITTHHEVMFIMLIISSGLVHLRRTVKVDIPLFALRKMSLLLLR